MATSFFVAYLSGDNHLSTIYATDYIHLQNEFSMLFEEFELLGIFAYILTNYDKDGLEKEFINIQSGKQYLWAPLGRAAWHTENRIAIFERWHSSSESNKIFDSDFVNGDIAYLGRVDISLALCYPSLQEGRNGDSTFY